jgi:hypothetical protein
MFNLVKYTIADNSDIIFDFKEFPVNYCIQKDGIYLLRDTNLATFALKIGNHNLPELLQPIKEGITLKIPKLPMYIFWDLVNFSKEVYKKHQSEVYVRVYYLPDTNEYKYIIPKQKVSGALAEWEEDDQIKEIESTNAILVLQYHSHHNMGGRFSGIDDADHVNLEGIQLVIGDIHKDVPSYQMRYCLGKTNAMKKDLLLSDLFVVVDFEYDSSKFANWEKHVNTNKLSPYSMYSSNRYTGYYGHSHYDDYEWDNEEFSFKKKKSKLKNPETTILNSEKEKKSLPITNENLLIDSSEYYII